MDLIIPDWPAPPNVRAAMTTRNGGVSTGPFASLNLGLGADDPAAVAENRRRLRAALALPAEPGWLRQVHGTTAVRLAPHPSPLPAGGERESLARGENGSVARGQRARDSLSPRLGEEGQGEGPSSPPEADASYTLDAGVVCVVQAADCLPVLLCDDAGAMVAAAHAGWRGLAAGVLEATVAALPVRPGSLMAWLGAAIGPHSFEVGAEVRQTFLEHDPAAAAAFAAGPQPGKYRADLYALARQRLARAGVARVFGGGLDTWADASRFFSYRRDGRCGRMAALAWRTG